MPRQTDDLSDERIEQLIGAFYVLPTKQKVVKVDRDEVLSLIREVKRFRSALNRWDRERAQVLRDLKAMGLQP
jgi:hypothetical protein